MEPGLGRTGLSAHLLTPQWQSPQPHAAGRLPGWGGQGRAGCAGRSRERDRHTTEADGTQEPPDCPQQATDPDHQQPGDTHARGGSLQAERSLHPRATPRAARGGGVCPLALRTTRPGSSEPPPPTAPGADLGLWAPGGQARHLILPAGQAGRHKEERRGKDQGEETDAERQTREMDRGLTLMDKEAGGATAAPVPMGHAGHCPASSTLHWPLKLN